MGHSQSLLARLFNIMRLAAYVTWVAVFVLLYDTSAGSFSSPEARLLAFGAMLGFLAVFVSKGVLHPHRHGPMEWTLLAVEGLFALAACAFWRDTLSPILLVIFMADAGMVLSARLLWIVGALVNFGLWLIAVNIWKVNGAWRLLLAYVGFQMFATLTAWYARRTEQTSMALREANAHLLATRSLLEESARDHERLRLARELHDVAGHKLTALKLNLTALQRETTGQPLVDTSAQLASELLTDIRGVVAQIRQHDGLDVRAALKQVIAPFPAPPDIHLAIDDAARVDSVAQADTLLRAVQEGVTNAVRHAGARNVWVELRRDGGQLHLQLRDDGRAELPLREGFGIGGMRERLAQLSGRLDISRSAAGGVSLDIQLPLTP